MLSPRGQTVLEAEILSSASRSCPRPRPRPRASVLGMSSDFVTWPLAYVYFMTKPKPMTCIRQYVPCHSSTNLLFTAIYLLILLGVCLLPVTVTLFAEMIRLYFLYVAYMRVMVVSCSYLLYEYLLKLKKLSSALSSASWFLSSSSSSGFCPRPRPRPQEFGLDQHHCQ